MKYTCLQTSVKTLIALIKQLVIGTLGGRRGKLIDGSKSSTDSKLWSEQEQLRNRLQFVTSTYGTPLGSPQK